VAPEVLPQENYEGSFVHPTQRKRRQSPTLHLYCCVLLPHCSGSANIQRTDGKVLLVWFSTNQFLSSISYNKNGMVEHNKKYTYTHKTYVSLSPSNPEKKKRLKRRRCTGCAGTYLTCVHVSCHRSFFHRLTITDGNGVACAAQRCPGSGTKRYGQIMPRVALRLLGRPINMDLELRVIHRTKWAMASMAKYQKKKLKLPDCISSIFHSYTTNIHC